MYHCSGFVFPLYLPTYLPYVLHLEGAKSLHRFFFLLFFIHVHISRPRTAGRLKHIDDLGICRYRHIVTSLYMSYKRRRRRRREIYFYLYICQTQVYTPLLADIAKDKIKEQETKRKKKIREREALVDSFYTKQWEWEIALVWNYGLLFFPCLVL